MNKQTAPAFNPNNPTTMNHPFADPLFAAVLEDLVAPRPLWRWQPVQKKEPQLFTDNFENTNLEVRTYGRAASTKLVPDRLVLAELPNGAECSFVPSWGAVVIANARYGADKTDKTGRRTARKLAVIDRVQIVESWAASILLADPKVYENFTPKATAKMTKSRAARWLVSRLDALIERGIADPLHIKIQKAAFSTYGRVPEQMMTDKDLRRHAELRDDEGSTGFDPRYLIQDYLRLRWVRQLLDPRGRNDEADEVYAMIKDHKWARQSLGNMPGRVTVRVVYSALWRLSQDERPQPFTSDRTEWIAAWYDTQQAGRMGGPGTSALRIVRNSTKAQVAKAMKIYREAHDHVVGSNGPFQTQTYKGRYRALRWILDVARVDRDAADFHVPTEDANIVTWAVASERYHRDAAAVARRQQQLMIQQDAERHAALRAIKAEGIGDLPEGFQQLRTYDDVVDEGQVMDHCVGTYAQGVVNGSTVILSYREGEEPENRATLQVEPCGNALLIRQCYGPRNRNTEVSRRAEKMLRAFSWVPPAHLVQPLYGFGPENDLRF